MREIVVNTPLIRGHLVGRIDLICKKSGLDRDTLRRKLNGEIGWKLSDLNRLCRTLQINADDVISFEEIGVGIDQS
ncbi:TPA: hypothetical protein EYO77_09590 [Candidatus Poribacteria bacterium]|nr:hypothetical protein [Candidatus Poribacteria bacterium]